MPLGGEPPDLHQLEAAGLSGHLQGVGTTTHQDVGGRTGAGLEAGPGLPGCRDGFLARAQAISPYLAAYRTKSALVATAIFSRMRVR